MAPEDRRAALIAATVPLLHEHGLDVSTRKIAEAAGVAEGTIFGVFPDKHSLVVAALWLLELRDWRCYGAAYLSVAVLHDIRLGALTPLLALGLALVWRWRAQARAAVPLALIIVAKLFLWPLTVWLVATYTWDATK